VPPPPPPPPPPRCSAGLAADDITPPLLLPSRLTLRFFETSEECAAALREARREIWVSDLSQDAVCLTGEPMVY